VRIEAGVTVAGRYRVERELSEGGMGAVYVARDTKFQRPVALKVAAASGSAYREFLARFRREALIGNALGQHPGVVRALDWGEVEEGVQLYLVMDLVDDACPLDLLGGTIRDRLERLLRATRLVCLVHAEGVVHRDLKPANFLQDPGGGVHLTDFGLAKVLRGEVGSVAELSDEGTAVTRTQVGMGTESYMPPEQFQDLKGVDERADVFALGVMLFEALTGELPFAGSNSLRFLALGESPPRARERAHETPLELDELCARAIALEPAQRLASARELADGIQAALTWLTDASAAPTAVVSGTRSVEPTQPLPAPGPQAARGGVGLLAVGVVGLIAGLLALASGLEPATSPASPSQPSGQPAGQGERTDPPREAPLDSSPPPPASDPDPVPDRVGPETPAEAARQAERDAEQAVQDRARALAATSKEAEAAEQELQVARGELEQATAAARTAEVGFQRMEALLQRDVVSRAEVDRARQEFLEARARVGVAEQRVQAAQARREETEAALRLAQESLAEAEQILEGLRPQ
jgi:eukaryotic-like serine/threonine-protein kinase